MSTAIRRCQRIVSHLSTAEASQRRSVRVDLENLVAVVTGALVDAVDEV